nr:DUF4113 domain-containing protein [Pseudomonas baetica]
MDKINESEGRGTLRSTGVPISPNWAMRRERMSKSHTARSMISGVSVSFRLHFF